jgi:hypothetical protein
MNNIYFIIFIFIFIILVIFWIKPKENFTNININDSYKKMNNIVVPSHSFHYDSQLADNKCLYVPSKHLNTNENIENENIVNENNIEQNPNVENEYCNIIENQQLKLNKNPYDFRIHRSNNSKGLYPNSKTFGSQ